MDDFTVSTVQSFLLLVCVVDWRVWVGRGYTVFYLSVGLFLGMICFISLTSLSLVLTCSLLIQSSIPSHTQPLFSTSFYPSLLNEGINSTLKNAILCFGFLTVILVLRGFLVIRYMDVEYLLPEI